MKKKDRKNFLPNLLFSVTTENDFCQNLKISIGIRITQVYVIFRLKKKIPLFKDVITYLNSLCFLRGNYFFFFLQESLEQVQYNT